MGERGRVRTPTPILAARGSHRAKSRTAAGEPQFSPGVGSCPAWLGKEAKAEWRRLVKELEGAGLGQQPDRVLLVAYCEAWGEYVGLCRRVDGLVVDAAGLIDEPILKLIRVKSVVADRLIRLAAQFGFSPAARSRVTGGTETDGGKATKLRAFIAD